MSKENSRIVTFSNLVAYNPKGVIGGDDHYIPVKAIVPNTTTDADLAKIAQMGCDSANNLRKLFLE